MGIFFASIMIIAFVVSVFLVAAKKEVAAAVCLMVSIVCMGLFAQGRFMNLNKLNEALTPGNIKQITVAIRTAGSVIADAQKEKKNEE